MISKKLFASLFLGLCVIVPLATGAQVSSQTTIQQLLALIAQLQAQLAALTALQQQNGAAPVINHFSGLESVTIGQQGRWTVSNSLSPLTKHVSYSVDWGDGTSEVSTISTTLPSFFDVFHTYSKAGTFNIKLKITSDTGIECIKTPCPTGGSAETNLAVTVKNSSTTEGISGTGTFKTIFNPQKTNYPLLAADYSLDFTTGSKAAYLLADGQSFNVNISTPGKYSAGGILAQTVYSDTDTVKDSYGRRYYVIPANSTRHFTVAFRWDTNQLFAGIYSAHLNLSYFDQPDLNLGGWTNVELPDIKTSPVSIVGEQGPYITSAHYDGGKDYQFIEGERLANSIVYFNNAPIAPNLYSSRSANRLSFYVGSVAPGSYPVYVVDSLTGRSNTVYLQVASPTTFSVKADLYSPSVIMKGSVPEGDATTLYTKFYLRVYAGDQDVLIPTTNSFGDAFQIDYYKNGAPAGGKGTVFVISDAPTTGTSYRIPAGGQALFTVNSVYHTNSVGNYSAKLAKINYGGGFLLTSFATDQVYVGEVTPPGPYIPATITITSPTGGEQWQKGTSHQITWVSQGKFPTVNIGLFQGANRDWLAYRVPNTGSYTWTIPSTQLAASDYAIGVNTSDVNAGDWTKKTFSITNSAPIPSPWPGYFISLDRASYSPTDTIGVTLKKATPGITSSPLIDVWLMFTNKLNNTSTGVKIKSAITGNDGTTFNLNLSALYVGKDPKTTDTLLLVCRAGCNTDVASNERNSASIIVNAIITPTTTPTMQSVSFSAPLGGQLISAGQSTKVTWQGTGFSPTDIGLLYLYRSDGSPVSNPYQDYVNRGMVIDGWNLSLESGSFNPTLRSDLPEGSYQFVFKKGGEPVGKTNPFSFAHITTTTTTTPYTARDLQTSVSTKTMTVGQYNKLFWNAPAALSSCTLSANGTLLTDPFTKSTSMKTSYSFLLTPTQTTTYVLTCGDISSLPLVVTVTQPVGTTTTTTTTSAATSLGQMANILQSMQLLLNAVR